MKAASPIWSGCRVGLPGARRRRRGRFHMASDYVHRGIRNHLVSVSVLAVLAAAVSYWGSGKIYSGLGSSDLEMRREQQPASPAGPGAGDPALREEVRQLAVARNERRLRQGKEPLDVDAEVERQLRDLGG